MSPWLRRAWGLGRGSATAAGKWRLYATQLLWLCREAVAVAPPRRGGGVARPRVWVSGAARPCATKLLRLCREAVAVALPRAQVSAWRTLYYTAAYNIYIYIYIYIYKYICICIWGSATRPSPRLRHARGVRRGACCVYTCRPVLGQKQCLEYFVHCAQKPA